MDNKNPSQKKKINKVLVYLITLLLIIIGLFWLNKQGEGLKNQKSLSSQKFIQTSTTDTKEKTNNQEFPENTPKNNTSGKNEDKQDAQQTQSQVNDFGMVGSSNHQYL